jgi:hypothetical protein
LTASALLLLVGGVPAVTDHRRAESVRADLLIENVRVFDPVRGTFGDPTDILVQGNRIAATGDLEPSATGVTRLEARGKYALPGLWDAHTHFTFLTLGGDSAVRTTLEAFARNGITNVRDVGGSLDSIAALSQRVASGQLLGPRIHYAGPVIGRRPLDSDLAAINEMLPGVAVLVDSEADVDSILDRLVRKGASLTKGKDRFDPALFRYWVSESRKRSLAVVWDPGIPIFNPIPFDTALAAGVTSFEHARVVWPAVLRPDLGREVADFMTPGVDYASGESMLLRIMALGAQSVVPARLAEVADRMAQSGVYFCPTLNLTEKNLTGTPPDNYRKPFEGLLAVSRLFARELTARGVKLLVGQDFIAPDGTWGEMEALARAGISPVEILRGATLHPAQSLGVADRFGSLERGMRADIVLLDADPLARIENIRSVWRVVYDGVVLSPLDR